MGRRRNCLIETIEAPLHLVALVVERLVKLTSASLTIFAEDGITDFKTRPSATTEQVMSTP